MCCDVPNYHLHIFSDEYVSSGECGTTFISGKNEPGLYYLQNTRKVYCDGSWTVILQRGQYSNPDVSYWNNSTLEQFCDHVFYFQDYFSSKTRDDYINGFGDPSKEYFIGLDWLSE